MTPAAIRRVGFHPSGTCDHGHTVTLVSTTAPVPSTCPALSCSTTITWRIK